jgi:4'-phosphopantetheinyl transferase EntD
MVPVGVGFGLRRVAPAGERILAEEAAAIAGAVPGRQEEFHAGRRAARDALQRADTGEASLPEVHAATPLRRDAQGRPCWPDGYTGSISHGGGLAVAVAGSRRLFRSLGIDLEARGAVRPELWQEVLTHTEQAFLQGLDPAQRVGAATLVFGLKEAFFKCQSPLAGSWLEFGEVEVRLGPDGFAEVQSPLCGPLSLVPKARWGIAGAYSLALVWSEAG